MEGSVTSMLRSKENEDKIRGALYGFAIGDAMGATTEFMNQESIQKKYGVLDDIVGGGWLHLESGKVTDDTQMMICVMEALQDSIEVGSGVDYFHHLIGANFVEWLSRGPKDVGGQCSKYILYYMEHGKPKRYALPSELGNGGLMRALPCALINDLELNLIQNNFTHCNNECTTAIRRYHCSIIDCFRHSWPYASIVTKSSGKMEPTGCVINTYQNAITHVTTGIDFSSAIISAVNDGGDADTIGALTGGLAGAMYGYKDIPQRWVQKLDPEIKKYLEKFVDFCCQR